MKPTTLLLAASLLANVALVGVIYTSRSPDTAASGRTAAKSSASAANGEKSASASHSANAASDAQGSDTARATALGQAFARFASHMWAAKGGVGAGMGRPWWQKYNSSAKDREEMALARRELSDAMIAAFGDDLGTGGVNNSRLSFLPTEKRDKLRGILEDYDELMAKFGTQGGLQLASDKEKLKLLTSERNHDIAALLSPEELADYEMRTSATSNTLRNRYGDGIASEEDFKKLYTLQKAFDDKFPMEAFNGRVTPETMKARSEAALQLQADMRAALGEESYAALKRASDSDLRQVSDLATRLNLPPDTTDRVAAMRDSYAAESQRITADTSIPFPQRREQLQALAARAKSDLVGALGSEAADAYAQRSQWMSMLQGGMGYSTTPTANSPGALSLGGGPGPSVFPVIPTGGGPGSGGGAVRQVVNVVSGTPTSAPGATMFFSPGGGPDGGAQTQVFSVATSVATTDARGPAADTIMTVVAPPPGGGAPITNLTPAQPAPATPPKP